MRDPRMRIRVDPARNAGQRPKRRKDGETVFLLARERGQSPLSLSDADKVGRDRGRHPERKEPSFLVVRTAPVV